MKKRDEYLISHLDKLSEFREEWEKIYRVSTKKSPFTSFSYTWDWCRTFASPGDIRVFRIRTGSETIGFMPLLLCREKGVRELRSLIGTVVAVPEPPVVPGRGPEFQEILLKMLAQTSREWDVFRHVNCFSFIRPGGFFSDEILNASKFKWKKRRCPNYSISLDKTFQDYVSMDLSKKFRRNLNLSRNRLLKNNTHEFVHLADDEAIKYWSVFLDLENSGWKGAGGTSISKMEPGVRKYYDLIIKKMAESGILHLYLLKIGQQVAAASLGYTDDNVFHEAKSAYDEDYAYFSPSNQLRIYMIEHIMTNLAQIKRIHMFPDDFGYKHHFVNESTEHIDTVIYSSSLKGLMVYCCIRTKNMLDAKRGAFKERFRSMFRT